MALAVPSYFYLSFAGFRSQSVYNVITGFYPLMEDEAFMFAGIQLAAKFGAHDPGKYVTMPASPRAISNFLHLHPHLYLYLL